MQNRTASQNGWLRLVGPSEIGERFRQRHQRELFACLSQADVANRPLYVLHELQHTSASIFAQPTLGGRRIVTRHSVSRVGQVLIRTFGAR